MRKVLLGGGQLRLPRIAVGTCVQRFRAPATGPLAIAFAL